MGAVGAFSVGFNIVRVVLHVLLGLWTCAVVYPFTDAAGRAWRIQHWSIKLLAIFRINLKVSYGPGAVPALRSLIVANHVSWLDIFVINALHPCRFVAKADIRSWPLLGWLSARSGTIFISRGRVRDVRRIFQDLVQSIRNGERIAFFPEGTTAAQGGLLPFHANLFEAAIDADVPIQPMALRYFDTGGQLAEQANFIGDTSFVESILAILKGGPLEAELIVLPPIDSKEAHRRTLAAAAQAAISRALGH